jgi:hypothetical protein
MKRPLATILLSLICFAASAQGLITGKMLFEWQVRSFANDNTGAVHDALVVGYVGGVIDQIITVLPDKKIICLPAGATIDEMRKIVIQFLAENPDTRSMTASLVIEVALLKKFPCKLG